MVTADDHVQPQDFAIHAQTTFTVQTVGGFAAPYQAANSLAPHDTQETIDATLYFGVRPWQGAELWINPEMDQGFGLSNTLGVAGFVSAEAYKIGNASPYARLQRLFLRQTISLGGAAVPQASAANQLAGSTTANRIVITAGKMSVGDVFDTNRYAHDPRADFLNWSLVDTGSFDYAADAWGYSTGIAGEWYQGAWTVRAGLYNLSTVPNTTTLEKNFNQNEIVTEIEHRHKIGGQDGAVRVSVFRNHGKFALLSDALAAARANGGVMPDLATLRHYADRWGATLNAEQAVTANLGAFLRAGITDGRYEAYDFTDIDNTAALGLLLKGAGWHRPADTVGLAVVRNGASKERQAFLAAGGMGILVGDGQLPHPGGEWIGETYYQLTALANLTVTADYQLVVNPAYNRDRGPLNVFALRLHGAF